MAKILMTLENEFPHDERVEKEAKALVKSGHEVHLICYTKTSQKTTENWNNIHIHRFKIKKWTYKSSALSLQFPFYFNKWHHELNQMLENNDFDVIHIHDLPLISIIWKLKNKFSFKIVLDLHENWPVLMEMGAFSSKFPVNLFFSYNKWIKYENYWLKKADKVITVIEEAKDRIINLGVHSKNTIVVSNTIDLESFSLIENPKKLDGFSMLYSGGVNEHRGLQIVIQALKILKSSGYNINLLIVGGGNYMPSLKRLANSLDVQEQLIDYGWTSYQAMMQMIVSAQILIIPHLKSAHTDATIPNKLFQYMFAQKPLLVSDCVPLKRIVNSENAGIVYENTNPKDLAEKIKLIYDDYDHHLKSSVKNKNLVKTKYNWSIESQKLDSLYSSL